MADLFIGPRCPELLGAVFDVPIADAHVSKSPRAVGELADLMSEISEETSCAGWLNQLAFYLWAGLVGASMAELDQLQALHDEAGGWVHWFHKERDPGRFHDGLTFVPTAEWLVLFEAWADSRVALGWARPEAVLHG